MMWIYQHCSQYQSASDIVLAMCYEKSEAAIAAYPNQVGSTFAGK